MISPNVGAAPPASTPQPEGDSRVRDLSPTTAVSLGSSSIREDLEQDHSRGDTLTGRDIEESAWL